MSGPEIDDYLKQGMYGPLETKPDERRRFLGTLRERVIIALTQVQMREKGIYPEVKEEIKGNPKATLILNGNLDYAYLSKYTKLAMKYDIESSIVTNKEHNSEIGLVLAADYAVEKENIYVNKDDKSAGEKSRVNKKGLLSFFGGMFKK